MTIKRTTSRRRQTIVIKKPVYVFKFSLQEVKDINSFFNGDRPGMGSLGFESALRNILEHEGNSI